MKKTIALWKGEAWKLQNLLKHYPDFCKFTAPEYQLNVANEEEFDSDRTARDYYDGEEPVEEN